MRSNLVPGCKVGEWRVSLISGGRLVHLTRTLCDVDASAVYDPLDNEIEIMSVYHVIRPTREYCLLGRRVSERLPNDSDLVISWKLDVLLQEVIESHMRKITKAFYKLLEESFVNEDEDFEGKDGSQE